MNHRLASQQPVKKPPFLLFPREHGSWGMLLFPLFSAMVLARTWTWNLLPAALGATSVFLLREPLVVLARQRYVWKDVRPETSAAWRSLGVFGVPLVLSGVWLLAAVPRLWLAGLGAAAAVLTAASIYGALHNMQRSPTLQIAGAAGLSASALLAYLAAGRPPDLPLLLLLSAHILHGGGSVLVVHARIEAARALRAATTAARRPTGTETRSSESRTAAAGWLVIHGVVALGLVLADLPLVGAVVAVPLAVHASDLARLTNPEFLRTPLRRVGFRELGLSTVFSVLLVAVLL